MSVVLKEYCKHFIYPTPYELHFSNQCLEQYIENPLSLCGERYKTDYDLAAHFTVIVNKGIVLYGESIASVFTQVPKNYYIDSICLDITNAKEDVLDHPNYVILNLCRVYAYIKEERLLSKDQAGYWALENISKQYHALVRETIYNYTKGTIITSNEEHSIDFCKYMLDIISNHYVI